jgi:hypothetical protein
MTGPPSLASRCCGDRSATATIVQRTVGLPEGKRRAPRDIEIFHMMYATIGVHNAAAGTPRHPGRTDMMTSDRHRAGACIFVQPLLVIFDSSTAAAFLASA